MPNRCATIIVFTHAANARYLPACLESLVQQSYRFIDIVVLSDGSDEIKKVMSQFEGEKRLKHCLENEIEGMRAVMPQVRREWCDQIIILDGGSTDHTVEYAKGRGYIVYVQNEPGLRNAYREVLPLIEGDVILTFSPDGNCIPEFIPALKEKMQEGYDMVIASRYLDVAWSEDDDVLTAFGNWLFTKTINLLHGGRYADAIGILRAYRKQIIYDLGLDEDEGFALAERLFHTRLSWEPLISVRAAKKRLTGAEIRRVEPPRIGGKRKLQIFRWGGAYYFQILGEKFVRESLAQRK